MLQQHELDELASGQTEPPAPACADPALSLTLLQQIENSLDRRLGLLGESIPLEARQKQRVEMRDHLYAVVRAHMELGSSPEEAVAAALRHMPDLGTTVQANTQTQTQTRQLPSARLATLLSIPLFGFPWLADNTRYAAHLWERWVGPFAESDSAKAATEASFYRFELVIVPLIAGLLVGLLARNRATRGVLNGLALLTIPAILFPGFMYGLGYAGVIPQGTEMNWLPSPVPGVVGLTYWVAMGCVGAGLGSRLRRLGGRLPARRGGR